MADVFMIFCSNLHIWSTQSPWGIHSFISPSTLSIYIMNISQSLGMNLAEVFQPLWLDKLGSNCFRTDLKIKSHHWLANEKERKQSSPKIIPSLRETERGLEDPFIWGMLKLKHRLWCRIQVCCGKVLLSTDCWLGKCYF